jgi:hypothetical protein
MPKSQPEMWGRPAMNKVKAVSITRSLYVRAATLAGMRVSSDSAHRLGEIVVAGYSLVEEEKRGLAVANLLRVMAEALEQTESSGKHVLRESSVKAAQDKICPVYPFGGQKRGPQRKKR